jgi:hypothetical protein
MMALWPFSAIGDAMAPIRRSEARHTEERTHLKGPGREELRPVGKLNEGKAPSSARPFVAPHLSPQTRPAQEKVNLVQEKMKEGQLRKPTWTRPQVDPESALRQQEDDVWKEMVRDETRDPVTILASTLKVPGETATRTGEALFAAMSAEAKASGWLSGEIYAIKSLTDPAEIAEFAADYVKRKPELGVSGLKYSINYFQVAPGTEKAWRDAILPIEREEWGPMPGKPLSTLAKVIYWLDYLVAPK